ncbi:MAG: hypothetical protein WCY62_06685 [Clostridia bacterium]|jgi:hypothetical protein
MKIRAFLCILLIALILLSGCSFKAKTSKSPVVSDEQSIEPSIDPSTAVVTSEEPLPTLEELYAQFYEAEDKEEYILALSLANRIISEYPEEDKIHWLKGSSKFIVGKSKLMRSS